MKKPWNIINLPVYSLATYNGDQMNMNICTYVSSVSMHPKKYMIALYRGTKTLQNMAETEIAVLQLLSAQQYHLIQVLGRKSGYTYDKRAYLNKKLLLEFWKDYPVLKNTSARLLLHKESSMACGDHVLFLFNVLSTASYTTDYLTIDTLREHKKISI